MRWFEFSFAARGFVIMTALGLSQAYREPVFDPGGAVPGLEVERPLAFAPLGFDIAQPTHELIAEHEHPARVVPQDLPQLLHRGVVGDETLARRHADLIIFGGDRAGEVVSVVVGFQLIADTLRANLLGLMRDFGLGNVELHLGGVRFCGFALQLFQRRQSLFRRRRL